MSEFIERTFTVSAPAKLELSNLRGSVEILPGTDGVIQITAQKQDATGDAARTEIEISQEADGNVRVVTRFPETNWLTLSRPCKVDYKILAPRLCSLKIKGVSNSTLADGFEGTFSFNSVSGEMSLRHLQGPVSARSVSGKLSLADLAGEVDLHSVSGEIEGLRINGALHVDTVSGKVELVESSLPSAEATTVSGGLELHTTLAEGPYRFHTVSGNVHLHLPTDTRCTAELRAVSGRITSSLPATLNSRQNGMQVIELLGGGVRVEARSVSGNLSLVS